MTNIYIYCLFDGDGVFYGAYSSLKAIHRDAIKLCNRGGRPVYMDAGHGPAPTSLTALRNTFKGKFDITIKYRSPPHIAEITKTKLKE